MRRAAKVDANQGQIVSALCAAGVLVQSLAMVGRGVPDLLCSHRGKLVLFECKDPKQPPSARKLTPDQEEFHRRWRGTPIFVVETPEDALRALGVL